MSRTHRALLTSVFAYSQYAAAIVISIVLVPMVLARVDVRVYGLWLASSDLLAYIGLMDLGVFGVLPWIVAEADGRGDHATIRRALSNGVAAAVLIGAACTAGGFAAWEAFPDLLRFTAEDRGALAGPLAIMLAMTIVTLPLNVYGAALTGLQDVRFSGLSALTRLLLNAAVTIGLLLAGWGLYGVAVGSAIPAVTVGVVSVVRFHMRYASLARGWPRPSVEGLRWLAHTSIGAWLGAFGWRLLSMSNGLILTATGSPELVPLYSCTARLSSTLAQMGWIAPDSGLVGLAQLHGEGRRARLQEITRAMLRLHLIIGGAAATIVLAVNPAFVSWWVSEALFGGHWLNTLLAMGMLSASLAHAFATIASVLGRRLEVGVAAIANGLVQVAAAFVLTLAIGFQGLAVAAILAAAVTTVPIGMRLLAKATGVRPAAQVALIWQWTYRTVPVLGAALIVGLWVPAGSILIAGALWLPVGAAYVWMVRPFYADLPLDPRFRSVLAALRLVPAAATAPVTAGEPVA